MNSLDNLAHQSKMPVLFIGHGNPMNAIETNEFTKKWAEIGKTIPRPTAIVCISAHWENDGTTITIARRPRTIHDFYGFPEELFKVEYPAEGNPELAVDIQKNITSTSVDLDGSWGIDHGCWSILAHLYPKADIPVLQLSLDYNKDIRSHFELAKELAYLRKKGVLIIGSGNLIHNLRTLDWNSNNGFDWAYEANMVLKDKIESQDYFSLINYHTLGKEVLYSIPSPEHYLPALYTLALKNEKEQLKFFNDKIILGSLSMTSFIIQ